MVPLSRYREMEKLREELRDAHEAADANKVCSDSTLYPHCIIRNTSEHVIVVEVITPQQAALQQSDKYHKAPGLLSMNVLPMHRVNSSSCWRRQAHQCLSRNCYWQLRQWSGTWRWRASPTSQMMRWRCPPSLKICPLLHCCNAMQ